LTGVVPGDAPPQAVRATHAHAALAAASSRPPVVTECLIASPQ
jgi:hypothetical protein